MYIQNIHTTVIGMVPLAAIKKDDKFSIAIKWRYTDTSTNRYLILNQPML